MPPKTIVTGQITLKLRGLVVFDRNFRGKSFLKQYIKYVHKQWGDMLLDEHAVLSVLVDIED